MFKKQCFIIFHVTMSETEIKKILAAEKFYNS